MVQDLWPSVSDFIFDWLKHVQLLNAIISGVVLNCGLVQVEDFDRMPNFDGSVLEQEDDARLQKRSGECFRLLVSKAAALRGFIIKCVVVLWERGPDWSRSSMSVPR